MPKTAQPPPSLDDLTRTAAERMLRLMERSEAAVEPFVELLDALQLLPPLPKWDDDVMERHSRAVDKVFFGVCAYLLESGELAKAIAAALPSSRAGAASVPEKRPQFPPLTRANATAFAAEALRELVDRMPTMETAFPGLESQYGDSDEEIDRLGADVKPYEQRFLRILKACGILEAALARATGSADLNPPAQADGLFTAMALETSEAILRPYFPEAVAEAVVPRIADSLVDRLLENLSARQLVVAYLGDSAD